MVGRRLRSQKQQVKPHTSHQVEIRPTPSGSGSQCERVKTTRWSPRAKQVESQSGKKSLVPRSPIREALPLDTFPCGKPHPGPKVYQHKKDLPRKVPPKKRLLPFRDVFRKGTQRKPPDNAPMVGIPATRMSGKDTLAAAAQLAKIPPRPPPKSVSLGRLLSLRGLPTLAPHVSHPVARIPPEKSLPGDAFPLKHPRHLQRLGSPRGDPRRCRKKMKQETRGQNYVPPDLLKSETPGNAPIATG